MSNDLTTIDTGLPDHLRAAFGAPDANSDLTAGVTAGFPIISYRGKTWAVSQGGDRTVIMDDRDEPVRSIEVVIVKANPHVSKVFYANGYTEGSDEKPSCFSHDGVSPSAEVEHPQSPKCAICPKNVWGSRVTELGAKGKACADSRRLAVSAAGDLANPMLLRVPAASLKDLMTYGAMLSRRGVPYQAVVTRIGFDHEVAYPKMTFKAERYITAGDAVTIGEMKDGQVVHSIMGVDGDQPAIEHRQTDDSIAGAPPPNMQTLADKPAATKPSTVVEDEVAAALAEKPAEPAPAPAKAKPKGFGGGSAAATNAPAAQAPEVEPARPATTSALIDKANASLDDVLSILDDA